MNLHYSKTDYDCYISKLGFYYPMNLHYSKTKAFFFSFVLSFTTLWIYTTPKPQKRIFEAATSVCITGHSIAFYYITSLLSEKHIECHTCANLFNYPAILHLFKCSNRHLKLLPAQKARKYTTPKLNFDLLPYKIILLQNLHIWL